MAGRKIKTWVWVVVGVLATCVVAFIAVAGAGVYFFSKHFQTRTVSPSVAAREFDDVTMRFRGEKPLVELDRQGNFLRASPGRRPSGNRAPEHLNVLAFDPDDSRVVRFSIPFWLLRLKSGGGSIDFNGNRMDLDDLKLSVEELERFGAVLIVDHRSPDGNRVLVWSQ